MKMGYARGWRGLSLPLSSRLPILCHARALVVLAGTGVERISGAEGGRGGRLSAIRGRRERQFSLPTRFGLLLRLDLYARGCATPNMMNTLGPLCLDAGFRSGSFPRARFMRLAPISDWRCRVAFLLPLSAISCPRSFRFGLVT